MRAESQLADPLTAQVRLSVPAPATARQSALLTPLPPAATAGASDGELQPYISQVIHDWSRTLTTLGITLIPLFFILDVFMMPRELLARFAAYRGVTVAIVIAQAFVLKWTRPSTRSYMHGYFFTVVVGLMIALMTTDLGGFNSTYYAGLNLVLIAVNLLLPWAAVHSAINSVLIIGLYVGVNLLFRQSEPSRREIVVNNLYFLASTGVITVSINYVKQKLITQEFLLRSDLKAARDALWGEMEVAKRIQTSLLPRSHVVAGYRIASQMVPADEVGGDYFDVIESSRGETWVCVGDVSGHGVESGLIMMMAQTSLFGSVDRASGQKPSEVLCGVNSVLKKNINRLGTDRFMTCMAMKLEKDSVTFAGKHQDFLVYRARTGTVEIVESEGVWLGLVDRIDGLLNDEQRRIEANDVILLYTDGVTEAMNARRELFGEERLRELLARNARGEPEAIVEAVSRAVKSFMDKQHDDFTVVALKRGPGSSAQ